MVSDIITPGETPPGSHGLTDVAGCISDERLQKLFKEAREEIVMKVEAGVKMFEMDKVTCLATDWSKEGVGFFMFQMNCD